MQNYFAPTYFPDAYFPPSYFTESDPSAFNPHMEFVWIVEVERRSASVLFFHERKVPVGSIIGVMALGDDQYPAKSRLHTSNRARPYVDVVAPAEEIERYLTDRVPLG